MQVQILFWHMITSVCLVNTTIQVHSYPSSNKACFQVLSLLSHFLVHPILCNNLFRRKKVAKATRERWPGNNIPIFRGNLENMKALNELVDELKGSCSTKYFDEKAIRNHAIDTLAERRRRVRSGYDYTKVCYCLIVNVQ